MIKEAKCFIIVLYNCRLKESESFKSVSESLMLENEKAHLYVYDNSPTNQIIDVKESMWLTISYNHDPKNSGLGIAYNLGVKFATELELKWVVLLDQDTTFDINYIKRVNDAIIRFSTIKLFAPMLRLQSGVSFSPVRYKYKVGHLANLQEGIHSLQKYSPVNSGMVISIEAFNSVGGYLEKVKLDFSDYQFIERFRKEYDQFYVLNAVGIQDYSKAEIDLNKNIFRFRVYMDCVQNCVRNSFIDDLLYFFITFKHMIAVCLKCQSFIFAKIFFNKYMKNN